MNNIYPKPKELNLKDGLFSFKEKVVFTVPDNVSGRCEIAKKYGMLGVLDTTWDWLHKGFHSIPLASCCCWEEKANYPTINGGLLIEIASQHILRKLMPSSANYANAGVFDHEIDSIIGTTG